MKFGIKPELIEEIYRLAGRYNIDKLLLFGSRARGDYKRTSDIDLAVTGGDIVLFSLALEDTATLLEYDVVNLDGSVQEELRKSIEEEGIVIYEKVCLSRHPAIHALRAGALRAVKYENFCRALSNLEDIYAYEEPYKNVVLSGLVALYEICFEQSWKAMKEILEENGFAESQTGSPRQILKTAYKSGMIKDEEVWLKALISRNNVAHAYNENIALDIVYLTKTLYYDMFQALKKEIEANWLL